MNLTVPIRFNIDGVEQEPIADEINNCYPWDIPQEQDRIYIPYVTPGSNTASWGWFKVLHRYVKWEGVDKIWVLRLTPCDPPLGLQ